RNAQGTQANGTGQFFEFQVFNFTRDAVLASQVTEILLVFLCHPGLAVDDSNLTRLSKPLHVVLLVFDPGLVDPLFDDLITDVIRAIDIKTLFIRSKSDRYRLIVNEDELRNVKGSLQGRADQRHLLLHRTHQDELPEPEVTKVELIELPVLHERVAQVKRELNTVSLILFKVMREHVLSAVFSLVDDARHKRIDPVQAIFEGATALVDDTRLRVKL